MTTYYRTQIHYKVGKYDVKLTGGTLKVPTQLKAGIGYANSLVNWSYIDTLMTNHVTNKHPTDGEWVKIRKLVALDAVDLSKINNLSTPLSERLAGLANKTKTNLFTGRLTVPTPTAANQLANKAYLLGRLTKAGLYAPGKLILRATGSTEAGALLADGRYVSKETYPNLFDMIGDRYLLGGTKPNPATDFRLPNLANKYAPSGFSWFIKT